MMMMMMGGGASVETAYEEDGNRLGTAAYPPVTAAKEACSAQHRQRTTVIVWCTI